jgi:cysteinyl-tRNA synthetase
MDCEFLGLLRHNKLWVHLQAVMGRNTRGLNVPHDIVRKLRISLANNLQSLQQESERALRSFGLGVEIAKDGNVTLIPLTQAARDSEKNIEDLILSRNAARARKDFKESDRIRDELAAMGIVLKDGKDADGKPVTTWEIAR